MRIYSALRSALRGLRDGRTRGISVYVDLETDGRRSVNIYGCTAQDAGVLMAAALRTPHIPAVSTAAVPAPLAPPPPLDGHPAFDGPEPF